MGLRDGLCKRSGKKRLKIIEGKSRKVGLYDLAK